MDENLDTTGTLPGIENLPAFEVMPNENAPVWKGNPDFYQTGAKIGQKKAKGKRIRNRSKKPAATPAKTTAQPNPEKIEGLKFSELKFTDTIEQPAIEKESGGGGEGLSPEDAKLLDAKGQAGLVLQLCDMLGDWISGGTFGEDLTAEQASKHNKRRAKFELDLSVYLATLDIPMHPGLAVAVSGMAYLAPAIQSKKGKEKVATVRDRFISKTIGWFFNRGKK